jgi:hypothetical protein
MVNPVFKLLNHGEGILTLQLPMLRLAKLRERRKSTVPILVAVTGTGMNQCFDYCYHTLAKRPP